jgi:ABC-type lipoprotein export system ATPase subunit
MSRDKDAPLVELADIGMTYPGRGDVPAVTALAGVSFAVRPRELVVVAGRSGSGKSTLLRIAAGLQLPTTGRVCWSGQDVGQLGERDRTRLRGSTIGFVFQGGGLIDSLTAEENVALPAVPLGLRDGRSRASAALERVGLADRRRHFPRELSGGEQQRVAFARALMADPPLLLVDEPTANLDRTTADHVIDLCRAFVRGGKAALIASHDPGLIGVAGRVEWLEREEDVSRVQG